MNVGMPCFDLLVGTIFFCDIFLMPYSKQVSV